MHHGCINRVSLMLFAMFATLLTVTGVSSADGLFDFQMTLANKGNVEAQFKVGEMYEKGFGVKQNQEEALKWITMAAEHGHETAGFKLLYYDIRDHGVNAGNKERYDKLNNKALAGNGQAEYYVGLMHANGVGVKKDESTALEWLSKASLVGITAAEAEITRLRESQQRMQLQQRREAEARKERDQASRNEDERKRIEAERKADEAMKQKQAEAQTKAKARAQEEQTRAKAAEQKKREQEERESLRAKQEAEQLEKEKQRQALLLERKKKEEVKKEEFESDPCSGKSARFLSTCR